MTAVKISALTKDFGGAGPAVKGISLEIASGELIGLLGPSGCGKTTTLKMIAGLISPTSGDITFDDVSMLSVPPEKRGAVMVFQNHLLFPYMRVADNVGFGLKMRKVPAEERGRRVSEALEQVRLSGLESRWPSELSGGQQQRVALARALVTRPRLLLLDEPLSNLDAHLRLEMRSLILQLQRSSGITTIFVTHDQQEAVILSDRTALIFEGELHQFGPPREFYEHPNSERVARFFGTENFISGKKIANRVETALGPLAIFGEGIPDGEVTLALRPEAAHLGKGSENSFQAIVQSSLYTGTATQVTLTVDDARLLVSAGAHERFEVGQPVSVALPPERIIVIPIKQK